MAQAQRPYAQCFEVGEVVIRRDSGREVKIREVLLNEIRAIYRTTDVQDGHTVFLDHSQVSPKPATKAGKGKPIFKTETPTPGPWTWFNYPDGRKLLAGDGGAVIHCPEASIEVSLADQQVIALVPDMLAALRRALPLLVQLGDHIGNGPLDPARPGSLGARCDLIEDIHALIEGRVHRG